MKKIENMYALQNFLIDSKVKNKIMTLYAEEFSLAEEISSNVETVLLPSLNNIKPVKNEENVINQAIFILFAQSIKSYKSGLILSMHGYYSNAVMLLRNMLEILFNIKFILSNESKRYKRAKKYLEVPEQWTGASVKDKAYSEFDKHLYDFYGLICNYVHANYLGTGQNYDGDKINIYPTEQKIDAVLIYLNAIYVYSIFFICDHYGFSRNKIETAINGTKVDDLIQAFNAEKEVLNFFVEFLRKAGVPEANIAKVIENHKKIDFNTIKIDKN